MNTVIWLVLFLLLLLIEILTMGLTTIWFAGGALIAALVSYLGGSMILQVIVFLGISLVLLLVTKPIAKKHLNHKVEHTNAERLIGMDTIVLEEVNSLHATGKVMINGIEWMAMPDEKDQIYSINTVVTIMGIQGVKLIVKEKEKSEE